VPPSVEQISSERALEPARPQHSTDKIFIPRRVAADGRLRGKVPVGSKVLLGEQPLAVDAHGRIDWLVPEHVHELSLRIIRPDGSSILQSVQVLSSND
jgi:hypothetical protein